MPTTQAVRIVLFDGVPHEIAMSAEELLAALKSSDPLVRVPTVKDSFIYVNPAHVVSAEEFEHDPDYVPVAAWSR